VEKKHQEKNMSAIQIDNPLIENYLAQFDSFSPEEQQIVFTELRQKRSVEEDLCFNRRGEEYAEQTAEERKAAGRIFIESWRGALKGAPDMTAKEIRAERLKTRYGDWHHNSAEIGNKSSEQDFLDFCEELAMPAWNDEDVERIKYERLK
jgi:hypothetical protein